MAATSKTKAAATLSKEEVIDSDVESASSSGSGSGSGSDGSDSESDDSDSDQNLEDIQPKKKNKERVKSVAPAGSYAKYRPPVGMQELKIKADFVKSQFEWDALASRKSVELWAIRAPKDLKSSRLTSLSIPVPRKDKPLVGTLKTKTQSYILRTAGASSSGKKSGEEEGQTGQGLLDSFEMGDGAKADDREEEGGEEMGGMRLLVPKVKANGQLYVSPLPIARRLLLTPDLTADIDTDETEKERDYLSFLAEQSTAVPTKRPQPSHLLKFRNRTYGYNTPGPEVTSRKSRGEEMDVEEAPVSQSAESGTKKEKRKKDKDESPAKAKKKAKKSKD